MSQQTAAFIHWKRYGIWRHLLTNVIHIKWITILTCYWLCFKLFPQLEAETVLLCFFSPGQLGYFVGVIHLRHKVLSSYQQFFCVHTRTRHHMSAVYLHAHLSLRWRNIELCWPTRISRAELKTVSQPGSKGYPQRKTPPHTCVPGSHSWHEASAVSPFLWDFGFLWHSGVASLSYSITVQWFSFRASYCINKIVNIYCTCTCNLTVYTFSITFLYVVWGKTWFKVDNTVQKNEWMCRKEGE